MARSVLAKPQWAAMRQKDGSPPADDGLRRPLRAVIVGDRVEYGNVRRLPKKLWETYGIAVVGHWSKRLGDTSNVDFAIILVDQGGRQLLESAAQARLW